MTDKEMHPLTVSQCISSDWCRGYNEAVKEANEVIKRQQAQLRKEQNKNSKVRNERNRFKTEVERLNYFLDCYKYVFGDVRPRLKQIKDEACKEFAERLKEEKWYDSNYCEWLVSVSDIDNLVKELTEGGNEKET